jgi:chromosomal replication initiation ATPase DnaA
MLLMKTKQPMDHALDIVCEFTGLDKDVIFSISRKLPIAQARHLFRWLAYKSGNYILYDIRDFEQSLKRKCDHSTIINSIKQIQSQIDTYPAFAAQCKKLEQRLKSLCTLMPEKPISSMHGLHYYASIQISK